MNILMINGSPRKGETLNVLEQLSTILEFGGHNCQIENLGDYIIENCKGCYQCFLKGQGKCMIDDDVSALWGKIENCDGLVISSPVYALGVSGTLKNFLDRISYNAHRPTMYNKPAAIISTTAGMGTGNVISQLRWIELLGFKVVAQKGFVKYPGTEDREKIENDKMNHLINIALKLEKGAKKKYTAASLIRVIQFYALKINAMIAPDVYSADYDYYKDKEFFVDTKVSFCKRAMGKLFFNIGTKSMKSKIKDFS